MRRLFSLLLLLASLTAYSSPAPINGASGITRTLFIAGYTNFRPYALNDRYGLTGDNQFSQLMTFGIGGTTSLAVSRGHDFDGEISFMLYQPQERVSPLDSSVLQIRGWELMTSMYGYDILKKVKAVDLVVAPGIFMGRVKLKRTAYGHPNLLMRYKNPFDAVMIRFDLRFNFWRLSIGARASYRHDLSPGRWKERDGDLLNMPGYRFREAQYVVYIGINFIDWEKRAASRPPNDNGEDQEEGEGENFD